MSRTRVPAFTSLNTKRPSSPAVTVTGIGIWDGISCTASSSKNDNARSGMTALTGTANAGNYCVNVYDSGNVPEDWEVVYEVQVVHP